MPKDGSFTTAPPIRAATSSSLLAAVYTTQPGSVWLADLDDTLIDTVNVHRNSSKAIGDSLRDHLSTSQADRLVEQFANLFRTLIEGHWGGAGGDSRQNADGTHADLLMRIGACQTEISARWNLIKKFSREVLIQLAAEDCGISLRPDQIQQCAEAYWTHLQSHVSCFEDAITLSAELARLGVPLYIMTSSDGRLSPTASGQFGYDPQQSYRLKAARVEAMRSKGLQFRKAFIGDPIDKPTFEYFDLVYDGIRADLRQDFDPSRMIVLGDSYQSDLEVPVSSKGAALGILSLRGQQDPVAVRDRIVSVGSWTPVCDILATWSGTSRTITHDSLSSDATGSSCS